MITDAGSLCTAQLFRESSPTPITRQSQHVARLANRSTYAETNESESHESNPAGVALDSSANLQAKRHGSVLMFGGTLSPADLTYLDEILGFYGLGSVVVAGMDSEPDASAQASTAIPGDGSGETSDHPSKLQVAVAVAEQMGLKCQRLAMPIGIARTDEFLRTLQALGPSQEKRRHRSERDRLVMRLASGGNARLTNRRVVIYGEEPDFVAGMVSLLLEAGLQLVLCASHGDAQQFRESLEKLTPELHARTSVVQAERFSEVESEIIAARPEILIANRDARAFARRAGIPFVCAGRPLCSRGEDGSILHIGYRGAMQLLDRLEAAIDGRGPAGRASSS